MKNRIFSMDSAKAIKAQGYGWLNAIHYMAPAATGGVGNLCPKATESCMRLCLGWESGQAAMVKNATDINSVRQSRIDKARRFMRERPEYLADLVRAIELADAKAKREGLTLCVRPNGSTDIAWEGIKVTRGGKTFANVFEAFPHLQFVDYTKIASRLFRKLPANYKLVLSRTESNEAECARALAAGHNVAAVFRGGLPESYLGAPVVNGDVHDLIHLQPAGAIIGLTPKGRKAKADRSGFVIDTQAAPAA